MHGLCFTYQIPILNPSGSPSSHPLRWHPAEARNKLPACRWPPSWHPKYSIPWRSSASECAQAISAFKALLPFSKPSKPSKPKYQHHKDMTRYKTNPWYSMLSMPPPFLSFFLKALTWTGSFRSQHEAPKAIKSQPAREKTGEPYLGLLEVQGTIPVGVTSAPLRGKNGNRLDCLGDFVPKLLDEQTKKPNFSQNSDTVLIGRDRFIRSLDRSECELQHVCHESCMWVLA